MKTRIALALCLVLFLPYLLLQSYIIKTDNRLLASIKELRREMTVEEVAILLKVDVATLMHVNNVSDHRNEKYVLRLYMGYITSRNLLIFFDEDRTWSSGHALIGSGQYGLGSTTPMQYWTRCDRCMSTIRVQAEVVRKSGGPEYCSES